MIRASGEMNCQALEECSMSPEQIGGVLGVSGRLDSPTVEIVVDEKPVLVGRNLERALRTLREIPEVRNGTRVQRAEVVAPMVLAFFRNIRPDVALSMAKLFRRSYFSRILIIQEIVMGSEKSVVICVERRFSWENLLQCGNMLNHELASAIWNRGMLLDLKLTTRSSRH